MALGFMFCVFFGVTSAFAQNPADYPQWRGVHRDGAASAFERPARWPEDLKLHWRVEVGAGYASPLIVGERVYVFTRKADDEVLVCLDARSGALVWQSGYPAPYEPGKPAAAHGSGPKATPAFHDGRIFTVGVSGMVAAFDASTGKLLWRSPPPDEPPYFNAASSPLALDDTVLAHPGNYGPLTAFDATTGATRWSAGGGGFFASPLLATISNVRQVVTITQKSVIGVALSNGSVLWEFPWAGAAGGPTPVAYRDMFLVSGLDQGVSAFRPGLRDGKWLVEPLWRTREVSMYLSTPVIIGDTLYGFSHRARGQYFALDAGTGATLWLDEPRVAENAAVVKADDLLLFLNDDAELIVARSSRDELSIIRRYTVAESATWAQPAVSRNRVYIRDATDIALWSFN